MHARAIPPEPPLHRAARTGDHAAIERLLDQGADVDERADLEYDHGPHLQGLTPLLTAARSIDGATVATLRLLLARGADLRARAEGGGDAAWYASGVGMRIPGLHPWVVLDEHVERLRFLLDAGLSPHGRNAAGCTCLAEACGAGDPRRVALLLERGVSPDPDVSAKEAARTHRRDRALFGADAPQPKLPHAPYSFVIPLFRAAESGSAACIERLLAAGASVAQLDSSGSNALACARSPEVVRALVEGGADLHALDEWGRDPLGNVLHEGSSEGEVDWPGCTEVSRALVEAGAPLEHPLRGGGSRLQDAAFTHNAQAVEFLLSLGARPQPESHDGWTPLHAVAWHTEYKDAPRRAACERIIRALVAAGNPVDARNLRGDTPLDLARHGDGRNDTAIRVLLELGADAGG